MRRKLLKCSVNDLLLFVSTVVRVRLVRSTSVCPADCRSVCVCVCVLVCVGADVRQSTLYVSLSVCHCLSVRLYVVLDAIARFFESRTYGAGRPT